MFSADYGPAAAAAAAAAEASHVRAPRRQQQQQQPQPPWPTIREVNPQNYFRRPASHPAIQAACAAD